MSTAEMFASVQYLVSPDERPAAVQLSMETWRALVEWLEDAQDRAAVKAALPKLRQGPQQAGALRWEDVESEWDGSDNA